MYVKDAITNSGNKYLFTVPYTPKTNLIENYFNQIKHYLKLNKKVLKFNDLAKEVKKAIKNVKKENYKKKELRKYDRKKSTLRKPKIYKDYYMRTKAEVYKKEQEEIINEIMDIINLPENNTI